MDNFIFKNEDSIIPEGKILIEIENVFTKKKTKFFADNMFVTAGKNSIAARLVETANKGLITYCALGTGTVAPALADTQLQTEIFRKLISVKSSNGKVATFQTFFTTSEANGTLREAGLFGDDATSATNSGTLFARVAINRTKTSSDTLSLTWSVTIG